MSNNGKFEIAKKWLGDVTVGDEVTISPVGEDKVMALCRVEKISYQKDTQVMVTLKQVSHDVE